MGERVGALYATSLQGEVNIRIININLAETRKKSDFLVLIMLTTEVLLKYGNIFENWALLILGMMQSYPSKPILGGNKTLKVPQFWGMRGGLTRTKQSRIHTSIQQRRELVLEGIH